MISVFAGFVIAQDTLVKSIAFALTIGVFIDAFLVRMTVVPAVMALLGHVAWWRPRLLDRYLPHRDHGGVTLRDDSTPEPETP